MVTNFPTSAQWKSRFTRVLSASGPFAGIVYRSSTPKYATETDLLTGEGSKRHGGRWNPVGIPMVYASLSPGTAMEETLAHYRYYGIELHNSMPRTFVAINSNLQTVLDLRLGNVRQRLRISLDRILTLDWRKEVHSGIEPITQAIGRAAFEVGMEGLIVPSAADPDGHNLLVFPSKLTKKSRLWVVNPGGLVS